jgi:transcriptional regulator with XRE-family HTH domain
MDPILAMVGAQVRRLRTARGLTQIALGQRIDINPNLLGRIERGQQNPTILTLARIATGLQVELIELIQPTIPPANSP